MNLDIYLIADITISFLLLIIALLVILKNNKSRQNRTFFLFSLFIIAWILVNYFSNNFDISLGAARIANHLVLFFSGCAVFSLTLFIIGLTQRGWFYRNEKKLSILNYLAIIPTLTPLVVASIERQDQVYAITFGPLAYFYFAVIGLDAVILTISLIQGVRHSKGQERSRIFTILWSIVAFLALVITTNAIIPVITGSFVLTNIGPLSSAIVVIGISYSIAKHKLFDIRLVIARALGYALAIISLALIYGFVAFLVINTITSGGKDQNLSLQQEIIYTLTAVIVAFTFQPLKRFFDRWTNKFFYRDAYDSQELLDDLNKVLVSTIELDSLLSKSAKVIDAKLKAEFVSFGIKEMDSTHERTIGTSDRRFSKEDIAAVRAVTPKLKTKTIIVDELDEKAASLSELLKKNDIAVLVRLTDTPSSGKEGIGYIVLGNKKSGGPYSRQDIKVLEIIADELVIAVQNALRFEEIKNFSVTLQGKVDEATRQLRQTNEKLRQLDQAKDDFISMASHQLRTPLTSIKGYVSMVMDGDAGKITKKQSELLDQAFISSQRMVYLIADLLNVSRLRTGKFIIEAKETNLADLVQGEIAQLTETAKARGLELTYDKPKTFPTLMLDETKVRQVVMNFADNAIYYTPTGGHIKVAVVDKGDTIECTVSDDGIGVPKAEQHHLFSKFYRAGNAKKARPDGTGLGLFMAKKVVVAQGGTIIFNTQENKGSIFGFSFVKKHLLPEGSKGAVAKEAEKATK